MSAPLKRSRSCGIAAIRNPAAFIFYERFAVVGCGSGSRRLGFSPTGVPGRSQAQTRVNFPTSAKTVGLDLSEMLQSSAEALRPPTKTTVGDPLPVHFKYILRPPPMSTKPAKLPFSVAWATGTGTDSTSRTKNDQQEVQLKLWFH